MLRKKFLHKKSLGQNFLTSPHYLGLIADSAHITKGETVLEIGPGEGALTRELLARGARVVAVEKDHRLIPILAETFAKEIADKQLMLIEGDALNEGPEKLSLEGTYKLVANIPYYITGALIKKYLTHVLQPSLMVILVQKEVAERIARSPKESLLSLSVKVYGVPKYIKTVPRGAFSPAPTVDSAIVCIENISRNNFTDRNQEERFFEIIHAGFAQKRKLLVRNLEVALGTSSAQALEKVGLDAKVRAEDVPLEKWLELSRF